MRALAMVCAALALAFFAAASPALAEEVLYCVDTAVTGFKWNERGEASTAKFSPGRFTIKIVSDEKRIVTGDEIRFPDGAGVQAPWLRRRPHLQRLRGPDPMGFRSQQHVHARVPARPSRRRQTQRPTIRISRSSTAHARSSERRRVSDDRQGRGRDRCARRLLSLEGIREAVADLLGQLARVAQDRTSLAHSSRRARLWLPRAWSSKTPSFAELQITRPAARGFGHDRARRGVRRPARCRPVRGLARLTG
jgi:hypothetical protein